MNSDLSNQVTKSDAQWRQTLTPEQYRILHQNGTEPAFAGQYVDHHENGIYACAACGQELFSSQTKFDSGSGWPSFWDVIVEGHVNLSDDLSLGMQRVEVTCSNCEGHLGHLFDDGPPDQTAQRYCINSAALQFKKN